MESISYNAFSQKFDHVMSEAEHGNKEYRITKKGHKNMVLMTEDNYNSILETMRILSNPVEANLLRKSIKQFENGEFERVVFND